MDYITMYLVVTDKNGNEIAGGEVLEFEKDSITYNLMDFINNLICGGFDSFVLYYNCTNMGVIGAFVKVENQEIIFAKQDVYSELLEVE